MLSGCHLAVAYSVTEMVVIVKLHPLACCNKWKFSTSDENRDKFITSELIVEVCHLYFPQWSVSTEAMGAKNFLVY